MKGMPWSNFGVQTGLYFENRQIVGGKLGGRE